MTIPETITYATIVNTVKNFIKTQCINIANYSALPAHYKNGYQHEICRGWWGPEGSTFSVSNGVIQITPDTVDSEMATYLNQTGVTDGTLDYPVDDTSILGLFTNLAYFCGARVCYAMSAAGNSVGDEKYLVYYQEHAIDYSQTKYLSPKPLGQGLSYKINTTELQTLTERLIDRIKITARVHPIRIGCWCW